eukprot:UN2744
MHVGTADSLEECLVMVQDRCPGANGADMPASTWGTGSCYCEFGMVGRYMDSRWQSCLFRRASAVADVTSQGKTAERGQLEGKSESSAKASDLPPRLIWA